MSRFGFLLLITLYVALMAAMIATAAGCATVPLSPQRTRQRIARDLAACLDMPFAQEHGFAALECDCRAQRACTTAGLEKLCAWSEWMLETRGSPGMIAGVCR